MEDERGDAAIDELSGQDSCFPIVMSSPHDDVGVWMGIEELSYNFSSPEKEG